MHLTRRVDSDRLHEFLSARHGAPLSYAEVGASLGALPTGYRHDSYVMRLGDGDESYRRAVQGLVERRPHRAAGVLVYPPDAPLTSGTTVALGLPLVGVHALAACRIVAVLHEASRFGFAYGTVAGHLAGLRAFVATER